MARYNERGEELPDPVPLELPLGMSRPLTLQEEIRRFVRQEFSHAAAAAGAETFEESDDFDVEDDEDLSSDYELDADQEFSRFESPEDLEAADKRLSAFEAQVAEARKKLDAQKASMGGSSPKKAAPEPSPAVSEGVESVTAPPTPS